MTTSKRKGRPPATGGFPSRRDFEIKVWELYDLTSMSCGQLARKFNVSDTTIHKILQARPQ